MKPYFDDGKGHVIYNADCREVLPTLANRSADLILTDPPFESEAHTLQRRVQHEVGDGEYGRVVKVEALPFAPIDEETRENVSRQFARIAYGWALVFCQVEASVKWTSALQSGGMVYKRTCVWIKPDGMPQYSGDRPGMGYESIVAAFVPGKSVWRGGGRVGVFTHNKNDNGGRKAPHPTTKPLPLIKELISLFYQKDNGLVLDPFMGSGTTLRAAKDLGLPCIGIELEEKYCEIAARRLEQEVFDFGDAK